MTNLFFVKFQSSLTNHDFTVVFRSEFKIFFIILFYGFVFCFFSGEITKMTEVTVSSKVSDVTFFPSKDGHGYNIVMTSQELPEIYSVQLNNGKITSLKGTIIQEIIP